MRSGQMERASFRRSARLRGITWRHSATLAAPSSSDGAAQRRLALERALLAFEALDGPRELVHLCRGVGIAPLLVRRDLLPCLGVGSQARDLRAQAVDVGYRLGGRLRPRTQALDSLALSLALRAAAQPQHVANPGDVARSAVDAATEALHEDVDETVAAASGIALDPVAREERARGQRVLGRQVNSRAVHHHGAAPDPVAPGRCPVGQQVAERLHQHAVAHVDDVYRGHADEL